MSTVVLQVGTTLKFVKRDVIETHHSLFRDFDVSSAPLDNVTMSHKKQDIY